MPISRENNLIFVHIPKNAGTSIQEKFKMEQAGGHQTSQQMRNENPKLWGDYNSFCVVRNPWDRMVSNYYYCLAEKSFWFDANNSTEKWELADGTEIDGKPQHPLYHHVRSAGSFEAWMEVLPTLNQSKKVDYREIHTPRTKEITYNVYKKEIELLNYKF